MVLLDKNCFLKAICSPHYLLKIEGYFNIKKKKIGRPRSQQKTTCSQTVLLADLHVSLQITTQHLGILSWSTFSWGLLEIVTDAMEELTVYLWSDLE